MFHRSAGVANDVKAHVRLLHIALDAESIAAGIKSPIEMAEVVTGLIIAIIAEFDAKTVKWTIMQAAEETFHDIAGLEVETFEGCEEFGVEAGGERLSSRRHDQNSKFECVSNFEFRISDLSRHILEKFRDNLVSCFAFSIGLKGANQTVAQHERRKRSNVLTSDVETALAGGAGTRGEN